MPGTTFAERADRPVGFLEVVGHGQTYLNLLYLLLSLPLGVVYFAFLVAGLSSGLGTVIIVIGLFILLFTLSAARLLASWERRLTAYMLGADLPPARSIRPAWGKPLFSLKKVAADGYTWKGVCFLLLKMPLGIISFVLAVTMISLTLSLLLAPLAMRLVPVNVGPWEFTGTEGALISLALGLLLGVLSLHAINGLAAVWRALARALLSGDAALPLPAEQPGPIIIP